MGLDVPEVTRLMHKLNRRFAIPYKMQGTLLLLNKRVNKMIRDITLGQYFRESFTQMDARVKIILTFYILLIYFL